MIHSTNYWDELRELPFPENYPTAASSQRLYDEMHFQRACQVVLWAIPAMSVYVMKKGTEQAFGAGGNGFVRCSYATAYEKIEEALERMARFVQRHG